MKIEGYLEKLYRVPCDGVVNGDNYSNLKSANEGDKFLDHVVMGEEFLEFLDEDVIEGLDDLIDMGSDNLEGIEDLLEVIGIDLPDAAGDVIPYLGEAIVGVRLLIGIVNDQKELKLASGGMRLKVALVRTIAVISKYGAKKVIANIFEAGGKLVATPLGPAAPLVGMIASMGGVAVTSSLIEALEPDYLALIKQILDLSDDDVFYYQHKESVDLMAVRYKEKTESYVNALVNLQ